MMIERAFHQAGLWARSIEERVKLRMGEDQGSSLIEFAVALPVMLLVVTGITTFGLAINSYVSLTDATNTAARQVAISRGETNDPCALAVGVVENAAPFLATSSLSFTLTLNGTVYTGTTCSSTSTTSGAAANLLAGKKATLQVTYPCSLQVFRANYGSSGCVLNATTTEVVQ